MASLEVHRSTDWGLLLPENKTWRKRNMTESDLKAVVTGYLSLKMRMGKLWYCYTHGKRGNMIPDRAGIPDILGIFTRQGIGFGIELKAPGKKPTKGQEHELQLIKDNNGLSMWADNFEDIEVFIEAHT